MSSPSPVSPWPSWATPLVFLALAIAWTWPAVVGTSVLGHHPDAPGTAWFLSAAPRLIGGLSDPLTGWPEGAHYGRPDSFLLLVVGTLGAPLGAVRLLGLTTVLGTTVSAWAAEALARQLGARPPWSLLAGLAFAFSGLAATALLEGYPYHLVDPWVPLFVGAWLRATSPGGHPRDGALAGLWFVLALLSTAWLGIVCVPLGLVILVAGIARADRTWMRGLAAAVLVAGGPVLLYVVVFHAGGGAGTAALADAGNPVPDLGLLLRRLAAPGPSIDLHGYTQSATLPAIALTLAVLPGAHLSRGAPGRPLLWAGGACLLLALGPALVPPVARALAHTGDPVLSVVASSVLRFPDRLTWGTLVCFGPLAAVALTRLSPRRPRMAAVLLGLAAVEAFAVPRLPWRQHSSPAAAPSAYTAHSGPVLDVWPEDTSPAPAWALWTTNLGCLYQVGHGRPIADLCIVSPGVQSPRIVLQQWVLDRWLSGRAAQTLPVLQQLGIGSVVVHVGVMDVHDQQRIRAALAPWGAPVESTDGGAHVLAVGVPDAAVLSPEAATAAWRSWQASVGP